MLKSMTSVELIVEQHRERMRVTITISKSVRSLHNSQREPMKLIVRLVKLKRAQGECLGIRSRRRT